MGNNGFKLYKPKDYCNDSNTFLLIKSAVIVAWEETCRNNTKQVNRVRYNLITPSIMIEQLVMYSCGKNAVKRNAFITRFKRAIRMAFPKFRFVYDSFITPEGFNLTNKTTLLQLYNVLKTYDINSNIDIEDGKKLHETKYKVEYI